MIKVCYVVTAPGTIRAFFVPQLKYLAIKGFDVTVICSYDKSLSEELGKEIHYIPVSIPRGLSFWGSIRSIRNLKRIFESEKFDLVQYSTPNATLYAAIAAKITKIKVRNYHLMGFRYLGASGIGKIILKQIEKFSCYLSTSIECVSHSNLKFGIDEGIFDSKKATVVWNGSTGGVDLHRFSYLNRVKWRKEIRSELGFSDDDFVFGFAGRITRDKGINEILKAFKFCNGAKLMFVGDYEGIDTLDHNLYVYAKENPDIIFHENAADIERYYAAMDVLLLPSYREGFGNVIIEAAAMGTPAIVSNIPGPIDAIEEGRTALVVPVKNVEALYDAMDKCLNDMPFTSDICSEYVAEHFDSIELCRQIYIRKKFMLGE